jgi:pyruvate,water dikinase
MQKNSLLITLKAIDDSDKDHLGAKAFCLARMARIRLRVPPGFCLTAEAYKQHLRSHRLLPTLNSNLDRLKNATGQTKQKILSDIRRAIIAPPVADRLAEQIEAHLRLLGTDPVAVRSSATAEDLPGHSFAGLHDTFLGINNLEDCLQAIKKCWASLWTQRAYEYREKNGFDHLTVGMAVIVQRLVPADASGVIFTADPATGQRERIVIEACFGLGDPLVSGRVAPDRFVVDKRKLKVVSKTISEKKLEVVLDERGSVKEQALTAECALAPSIRTSVVRKLARLAKCIEAEFGCPQDIEWALCGKKIHLLQSRPITTLPAEKTWEERQIWSSNPAKEVLPDVATPATLSILDLMGHGFFDPVFRMLCMERGDHPIFDLVAGRVYFNANIWAAVIRSLPGARSRDFTALAGSHQGLRKLTKSLQATTDEDLPGVKFNRLKFFSKMPLTITGAFLNTPKKGRRILAEVSAKTERWNRLDICEASTEQIIAYCQGLICDTSELLGQVLYLFSILVALPVFHLVCAKWFPHEQALAPRLLAGLGNMDDAVAGLDLWHLAVAADANTEVKDLILTNQDWSSIEAELSKSDYGRNFLEHWANFMDRHGHHCRGEIELYN